ncbi:hypothetical protein RIF29_05985 [Crotalaria pallida]|uniref:Uncharacterized protein n=1 Tax=Crotalaria pallida TaxID=3830 RepID=A0AAN9J2T4_CROPI
MDGTGTAMCDCFLVCVLAETEYTPSCNGFHFSRRLGGGGFSFFPLLLVALLSCELATTTTTTSGKLNPILKGVLEINPDALAQAEKADQERRTRAKAPPGSSSWLHRTPLQDLFLCWDLWCLEIQV